MTTALFDTTIQLCGEVGCLATEMWADGLCKEHWDKENADPRAVTAADLQPGYGAGKRRAPRRIGYDSALNGPSNGRKVAQCAVDGCGPRVIRAKGYCNAHYKRWHRTGDPGPPDLLRLAWPDPPKALPKVLSYNIACTPENSHLFDADYDDEPRMDRLARHWEAAKLCQSCPALQQCRTMLSELVKTAPWERGGQGIWAAHHVLQRGAKPVQNPHRHRCNSCGCDLPIESYPPAVQRGVSFDYTCRTCKTANRTQEQRDHSSDLERQRREDPEYREKFNAMQRERRSNESPEARELRLQKKREKRRAAWASESLDEREARLERKRADNKRARDAETQEQREDRKARALASYHRNKDKTVTSAAPRE